MRMRQGARKKVLAVLPVAGEHAKNPGHISCVENELGLRGFLEERNCEYIVTAGAAMAQNAGLLACMGHRVCLCIHTCQHLVARIVYCKQLHSRCARAYNASMHFVQVVSTVCRWCMSACTLLEEDPAALPQTRMASTARWRAICQTRTSSSARHSTLHTSRAG